MRIILILLVTTLVGCASARNQKLAEYKKITKDICIDNQHEVKLAQILYNKMLRE
jgi:uncharacterized protein YceK